MINGICFRVHSDEGESEGEVSARYLLHRGQPKTEPLLRAPLSADPPDGEPGPRVERDQRRRCHHQ